MTGRIWLIAGPTASGKSALALRLAEHAGAEIVNADSMQLYRDLPILSARPSPEDKARAPHHLFGTVDAADGWSVGRWLRAATEVICQIDARGRPAIVVGGTGLYFSALTKGLADIPAVPTEIRREVTTDYDRLGEAAFRERLAAHDPMSAERIEAGDRQRLIRAWAVYAATGKALSDWRETGKPTLAPGTWRGVALEPPRETLNARCDTRLRQMVEAGVLAEVAALAARDLAADLPALKAVGVREFIAHLRGETSLEAALDAAQRETRRYAKRQMTWMRGQMADWPRLDEIETDGQWRQFLALNPALTP